MVDPGNGGNDAHASFRSAHLPFEPRPAMAPVPEPHPEVQQQRDNVVVLLGVSCIAACCMCWFLEHLAFLLRPLVFAVGLSLILRPFVDFVSDARYQKHKLRVWNARPPWHPRVLVIPRLIALPVAIATLVLVSASFLWALYLSEEWITQHWQTKEWNDRFIARINELADFTDKIALRILGENDFALASWHTLQDQAEITLKDESFWTSFANNLFNYLGDIAICMFYVVFLLAPPRTPARLQSTIVRRIHAAVKRFVMIMVALSAVRATLVGLLIWACGVPGSLSFTITVVSFWLFFIPNLGSVVAAAVPLPLLVLLPDLTTTQRWCGFFIPGFAAAASGASPSPSPSPSMSHPSSSAIARSCSAIRLSNPSPSPMCVWKTSIVAIIIEPRTIALMPSACSAGIARRRRGGSSNSLCIENPLSECLAKLRCDRCIM